jgi:hypothetical protein
MFPSQRLLVGICSLCLAAASACSDDPEDDPSNGVTGAWGPGELVLAVDALGLVVPGVTVNITEPECGGAVIASGVTDGNGRVSFSGVDSDWVYVQVVGNPTLDVIDSWSYHIKVGDPAWAGDRPIPIPVVAGGSARVVEASAMFTADEAAGAIVGAVYEGTGPGDRSFAGCVTIAIADDPANATVRYFGNQDLPNATSTATSTINGRFYVGNATPGEHTINVFSGNQMLGSATVCIEPRSEATTDSGNVFLVGVYLPVGTAPACN